MNAPVPLLRSWRLTLVILLFAGIARPEGAEVETTTYTYKTVDKIDIKADLYRVPGETLRPAILWIHGGALIVGDRQELPAPLRELPRDAHAEIGPGVLTGSKGKPQRWKFYLYCRQNGLWPVEVTGHDPSKNPQAFDAFCPVRNVTKDYPPTLLIHGDRDTDVPVEQSVQMEKELQRVGVEHEFIKVAGAGHGFSGSSRQEREELYRRAVDFAKQHTK